jgi:hypothetical protein
MARVPSSTLALLVAALFAGCSGNGDGDTSTTTSATSEQTIAKTVEEDFDGLAVGARPPSWQFNRGAWGNANNASDTAHPKVLEGAGDADVGLSSITAPGSYTDFEAAVSFKMISGEHPQGAGLVFHYFDDENYQIIRYSASEQGWHLFTMVDGNRQKQDAASVTPPTTNPEVGVWVDLRVESSGEHVKAFDGNTLVIDYDLPADAARHGRVGPFVRGNTIAAFDDFRVEAI